LTRKIASIYIRKNIENSSELANSLIYTLCSSNSPVLDKRVDFLSDLIFAGRITNKQQLKLADSYFHSITEETFSLKDFEKMCEIGVIYEPEDLKARCKEFVDCKLEDIKLLGGKMKHPDLINDLKRKLPSADPSLLLKYSQEYLDTILPKNSLSVSKGSSRDTSPRSSESGHSLGSKQQSSTEEKTNQIEKAFDLSRLVARELPESLNSKETLEAHFAATGGKVITRFPPEPNGILHIGHARAIRFNFGIADSHQGECNLRYDDTNPEKETREFMDRIEEDVRWMGCKPARIVHASHYFPQIYDWTVKLIKQGKAYVCKLPTQTLREYREKKIPSPYRETSPDQNLEEFEKMRSGVYAEGEAVLRAKIDYQSVNPTLRDPVIYRVLYTPHPETGNRWCIYPLYDYAHPLSDSIENITHSLCTLEFETRRELYYWPLQQLNLFKPYVWEFSRLNLTHTITSKRKILQLIKDGVVSGWDDPRLFTISGLRRRGVPVEALNEFLDHVPVTRRGNENFIQMSMFEHVIMTYLDKVSPRTMAVSEPLEVELLNQEGLSKCKGLVFPAKGVDSPSYEISLGKLIYLEKRDVIDRKLAPGSLLRLKYGPVIKIHSIEGSKVKASV